MGKDQIEEFIPISLKFTIGGVFQGEYAVEFKDSRLIIRPFFSSDMTVEIMPTPSEWKRFWQRVDDLQVWKWKKNYSNNDICDGTQWSLKIKIAGKTKNCYGSNSYPESFEQFQKILSELVGGLPIEPKY